MKNTPAIQPPESKRSKSIKLPDGIRLTHPANEEKKLNDLLKKYNKGHTAMLAELIQRQGSDTIPVQQSWAESSSKILSMINDSLNTELEKKDE